MDKTGKIIRVVAIIMLGLTAAMNLLGGIGTTCAAFSSNVGYRMAFKELMDYRWLYQILVVTTIIIGLAGIWATFKITRGGNSVYRNALIVLVVGSILGGVQFFASMALRGKATPANVKFFLNLLTLILFLVFTIPAIWKKLNFNSPGGKNETRTGAGLAAIIIGVLTLTVFIWAGPSHTFFSENWTTVLFIPLTIVGIGLILWGIWMLGKTAMELLPREIPLAALELSASQD
jgi:hypothetical protein